MLKELERLDGRAARRNGPAGLGLEPVLPAIGGTVTEVLEHYLAEPVRATRLSQWTFVCAHPVPDLMVGAGERVLDRRVVLRGTRTARAVLYAESLAAVDRLDPRLRDGLLSTDKPIGRLIRELRTEIFREPLACCRTDAGPIGPLLGLPEDAPLLKRTYRMFNRGQPILVIAEWFPC